MIGLALALSLQSAAPAPPPPLSLEQRTAVRCAAAFALTAQAQARGEAQDLPAVAGRGREFFVRVSARLMDETGRTRDEVADLLGQEARALAASGEAERALPGCMVLLDAAGL